MEGDRTHERREEQARVERALDCRERTAGGDRNRRGGERERPRDLPEGTELIARPLCERLALRCERDARGRANLSGSVQHRGLEQGLHLRLLLHDRLQERQVHPGFVVGVRAFGDLAARAAEDVRIEELVGDERPRPGVVLGAPLRRDAVPVFRLEPGAL